MSELDGDVYYPKPEAVGGHLRARSRGAVGAARHDPQGFWAARAAELDWYAPWDKVLDDAHAPFFTWFTGRRTNIVANCVDRH